jgi:arabinose-5-phosphate isomerase
MGDAKAKFRRVLEAEAAAISAVEVTDDYERALHALLVCRGKVVATGIGKAGFMAHKFAAVLCSTGTPAAFVHPAEAAHGDLGLISEPATCIVAFSTSGKTREVVELIELSRAI